MLQPEKAPVGWVGLGREFSTCGGLDWVGSVNWWVGLGRVTENGPIDNSGQVAVTSSEDE